MTKYITDKVRCPKCGNEWDHKIYQTVNVDINPELKEKIFNKEIFMYTCPTCGNKTWVITPLLYDDMSKNLWIYLWPYENEEIQSNSTMDRLLSNMKTICRRVKNENELTEKIRIFDSWFKDEYIELLKLSIVAKYNNVSDVYYIWIDNDNILFFYIMYKDWNKQVCSTPLSEYEKFTKEVEFEIPSWKPIEVSMLTVLDYAKEGGDKLLADQPIDKEEEIDYDNMPLKDKLERIIRDMRPDDKINVSKLFEDDNKKYDNFLFHKKEAINPENGKNYSIISVNKEETRYYILRFPWEKLVELFPKAKNKDWTPDKFIRIWFKEGKAYWETWDWNPLDVTAYIFQKSGI